MPGQGLWTLFCIREGLGQFVPTAQVKAVMPYPEVCILALSLLMPGFPGGSDGKESAYNASSLGYVAKGLLFTLLKI